MFETKPRKKKKKPKAISNYDFEERAKGIRRALERRKQLIAEGRPPQLWEGASKNQKGRKKKSKKGSQPNIKKKK